MATQRDIAVIVGSLRKESFNRKIAQALIAQAPAALKLGIVEIRDLPMYDQDLETDAPPAAWTAFRERVKRADGVVFVTPEYNRGTTAALKNALDVGSRPYGRNVFGGKPGAVVSVSIGALAGFGANMQVRQSCVFLDVPLLQQPEMYIGGAEKLFDEHGRLANESTKGYLDKFLAAYAAWAARILGS